MYTSISFVLSTLSISYKKMQSQPACINKLIDPVFLNFYIFFVKYIQGVFPNSLQLIPLHVGEPIMPAKDLNVHKVNPIGCTTNRSPVLARERERSQKKYIFLFLHDAFVCFRLKNGRGCGGSALDAGHLAGRASQLGSPGRALAPGFPASLSRTR